MRSYRAPVWILPGALLLLVVGAATLVAQSKRDVSVTGRKYTYVVAGTTAAEIRVNQNDMVTVTFQVDDIAHSFTIGDDHYRIDSRAAPGVLGAT